MIVIYILAGLIGLIIVLGLIAPKKYELKRNILINKPVDEVFQYIKFVRNQDYWSPWKKRDPNMKQSFIGTDGELGFISKWDSDHKQVGAGEQELKGLQENDRIDTEIRFLKPWKSKSEAYIVTKSLDSNLTEVTWGFKGINKTPINLIMLFCNMDKAVGKDFEEGLACLKEILEQK